MSALALIQEAHAGGVKLRLVGGKVRAIGTHSAVARLIEPLRQHREELLNALQRDRDIAEQQAESLESRAQAPWHDARVGAFMQEPSGDPSAWRELSVAYYHHHCECKACQAAGRGASYGQRCDVGLSLWRAYSDQPL